MTSATETGHVTGTADKDYNLIWFAEACLNNALRLQTYVQDAELEGDTELADLFRRPRKSTAVRAASRPRHCSRVASTRDPRGNPPPGLQARVANPPRENVGLAGGAGQNYARTV
jgi:hypothetical protein